jgi:hypothetical protein
MTDMTLDLPEEQTSPPSLWRRQRPARRPCSPAGTSASSAPRICCAHRHLAEVAVGFLCEGAGRWARSAFARWLGRAGAGPASAEMTTRLQLVRSRRGPRSRASLRTSAATSSRTRVGWPQAGTSAPRCRRHLRRCGAEHQAQAARRAPSRSAVGWTSGSRPAAPGCPAGPCP